MSVKTDSLSFIRPATRCILFLVSIGGILTGSFCGTSPKDPPPESKIQRISIPSNQHRHGESMALYARNKSLWDRRKTASINRIKIGMGLFPFLRLVPTYTPPVYRVVGEKTYKDIKIQNIAITLFKGFYIFGNLYIPAGHNGPFPAILNPHGHFPNGRFSMDHINNVVQRCVNFARQGMVAFTYDLTGYGESNQQSHWGHRYTMEQELRGFIPQGIETWKAVVAIDFLASLPVVDPQRIGITGASGGGHISVMAGFLDSRIRLVAAVNNPYPGSDAHYCCTGSPFMFDISECELAALVSPKPMMIVSNRKDFTKDFPSRCLPVLKQIYRWDGYPDHLTHFRQNVIHGYNQQARKWAAAFFTRHFLNRPGPCHEIPASIGREDIRLFKNQSEYPADYTIGISGILSRFTTEVLQKYRRWTEELLETDLRTFRGHYRKISGILFWKETAGTIHRVRKNHRVRGSHTETPLLIGSESRKYRIPVTVYKKRHRNRRNPAVLILSEHGRNLPPDIIDLFIEKYTIYAPDLFGQGELKESVSWHNPRTASPGGGKYLRTLGFSAYDPTLCARRINDILLIINCLKSENIRFDTIGLGKYGPTLLLARTQYHSTGETIIDMNRFRDSTEQWSDDDYYIPLILRYGGIGTMSNLVFPERLFLYNTGSSDTLELLKKTYLQHGYSSELQTAPDSLSLETVLQKLK